MNLSPGKSLGHRDCQAFVDGPNVGGIRTASVEDFEVSTYAKVFRAARIKCQLTLRDAAALAGISVVEMSKLERGKLTTDEDGWNGLFAALNRAVRSDRDGGLSTGDQQMRCITRGGAK